MDDINNANGLERAERHLIPVKHVIDIKPWFAQMLKKELSAQYTFCRIDVVDVLLVTQKAVQITGYFNTTVSRTCYCCGALLDTEVSRASGIGPTCAKNRGVPRSKAKDAPAIIEFMDQLARTMGKFTVWVPRRQILTEVDWDSYRVVPAKEVYPPLAPRQIRVASWLAAKNNHPEVFTVLRKVKETAKWLLLATDVGELGIPKSQIVQGDISNL